MGMLANQLKHLNDATTHTFHGQKKQHHNKLSCCKYCKKESRATTGDRILSVKCPPSPELSMFDDFCQYRKRTWRQSATDSVSVQCLARPEHFIYFSHSDGAGSTAPLRQLQKGSAMIGTQNVFDIIGPKVPTKLPDLLKSYENVV